jgi:hypothetical protein
MRRIIALVGIAVVLVVGSGLPAQAGGAAGSCPAKYQLVHTFKNDPVSSNGRPLHLRAAGAVGDPGPRWAGSGLVIENVLR